ncbi:MarR family winged helix-turn-helix transcriptional regulator [Camelimonas abortus]|uniref:MarR family winged helix-turn-helix transcriptional regulator n=1 Tax=Camelimonas abortus TaxID=1017184 RepID=A0ABV7LEV5_9HYPH
MKVWLRFVRLNRRLYARVTAELRAVDLSVPQFDVLSTLSEHEGLSQQELADRLYVTKGNVSGLVDRLVRGGLAERRPLPGDRRSHALHLTDRGRAVAEQALAIQRAYVQRTLGRLPPQDIAALDRIQRAWRAAIDEA